MPTTLILNTFIVRPAGVVVLFGCVHSAAVSRRPTTATTRKRGKRNVEVVAVYSGLP